MNLSGKGDWKVRKGVAEAGFKMESPSRRLGVGAVKGKIEEMVEEWFFTRTGGSRGRETRRRLDKDLVVRKKQDGTQAQSG